MTTTDTTDTPNTSTTLLTDAGLVFSTTGSPVVAPEVLRVYAHEVAGNPAGYKRAASGLVYGLQAVTAGSALLDGDGRHPEPAGWLDDLEHVKNPATINREDSDAVQEVIALEDLVVRHLRYANRDHGLGNRVMAEAHERVARGYAHRAVAVATGALFTGSGLTDHQQRKVGVLALFAAWSVYCATSAVWTAGKVTE